MNGLFESSAASRVSDDAKARAQHVAGDDNEQFANFFIGNAPIPSASEIEEDTVSSALSLWVDKVRASSSAVGSVPAAAQLGGADGPAS